MLNLISNLIKKIEFETNFKVVEFEFEPNPCDIDQNDTKYNTYLSCTRFFVRLYLENGVKILFLFKEYDSVHINLSS